MGSGEVEKVAPRPPVPRTETKTKYKYSSSQSQGTTLRLQVLAAEEMPEEKLQVQCGDKCREPHRHVRVLQEVPSQEGIWPV